MKIMRQSDQNQINKRKTIQNKERNMENSTHEIMKTKL